MKRRFVCLVLLVMLIAVGCSGFAAADVSGTLEAGDAVLATEAGRINATGAVERTAIFATVAAHETVQAEYERVNLALGATLDASSTATPTIVAAAVVPPPDELEEALTFGSVSPDELSAGSSIAGPPNVEDLPAAAGTPAPVDAMGTNADRLRISGITAAVDPSGCPASLSTRFSPGVAQLYLTFRALDLPAGSTLSVTWAAGGQIVAQDEWVTPRDFNGACLWFLLDNALVPIVTGQWSASLFLEGQAVGQPVQFEVS